MIPVRYITDDVDATCPHCGATVTEILARRLRADLGKAYLYFCAHCRKTLGVSHRKGFWMG